MYAMLCTRHASGRCGASHDLPDLRSLWQAHERARRPSTLGGGGPAAALAASRSVDPAAAGRGGGGRKARRGDIRTAALLLLAEEPRNGYQIMQEVQERSEGAWRPSPGSVYPALQQLEDEGLIRSEEVDGRKLFRLTDEGLARSRSAIPSSPRRGSR